MLVLPALLISSFASAQLSDESSLFAAVPEHAFALLRVADPDALRSRAERNDWVAAHDSLGGEPALLDMEREFEAATGVDFDGLFEVAMALHGEALLFFSGDAAGFLTAPPVEQGEREALAGVLNGWLVEARPTIELAGGRVQLGAWPGGPDDASGNPGRFLAFLDHPLALGLYSADTEEAVLKALADSLGALGSERRAPVVEGFFAAGGGTTGGLEAFVDFTPFVPLAEEALRDVVEDLLPDPTGLLGLERGTWLFASADVHPGTRVDVRAQLRIPEYTLAARLADAFEPLPRTLVPDLPYGTWSVWAFDWNLSRFYATAREGLEQAEENGLKLVDQGLEVAGALSGVDPIRDVIDQLSGWFAWYLVLDQEGSAQEALDGFGFLAGLVDGYEFLDAFETVLGAGGIGVDAVELEGADTYFLSRQSAELDDGPGSNDGEGLSILPQHLLLSLRRETLVRGLRALGRVEGAGLAEGSELQGAFDENAGAFAFVYTELSHLRTLNLLEGGPPAPEQHDPFDSRLIMAIHRTTAGFELRLYTR